MSEKEQEIKVTLNGKEILSYVSVINHPPLSPETIEVIRVALHELKCLNVEELLGITKIDFLKKQVIKQAQEEFNKVYGGGE